MPRPKGDNDTQFAMRVPAEWLPRADDLRALVGRPGISATRTDVMRVALSIGLNVLEAEHDKAAKAAKAGKRKS